MKLKDFKNTKILKKEVIKKSFQGACECCFGVNPSMEDGYTICCNELRVDGSTIIKMAKQMDIRDYLATKFQRVSSSGNLSASNKATFELQTKNKKFDLYLNQNEESLIESLTKEIKGLRKDV